MTLASVHGVPRIGPGRELKRVLERHWTGTESIAAVHAVGRSLRARWWTVMRGAGIDLIPSNDFSLYDHVLDTIALVGAVPPRFEHPGGAVDSETYFAMARGRAGQGGAAAMALTKWFGTNYHHIVPEVDQDTRFALSSTKPFDEFEEAKALGVITKPVLLGPVTFLLLSRPPAGSGFFPLSQLAPLVDVYAEVLRRLAAQGADWVQLDESGFVQDRTPGELDSLRTAYRRLAALEQRPRLLVSTSFGSTGQALAVLARLPVEGIGLDLVGGSADVGALQRIGGLADRLLAAGVVDGHNVWANDLTVTLRLLRSLQGLAGELAVSTSCSLLHVPDDVSKESALDPEVRSWLAFARQKVDEVAVLTRALQGGDENVAGVVGHNRRVQELRRLSGRFRDRAVAEEARAALAADLPPRSPYPVRVEAQGRRLRLPLLPTTTIGSFPQTQELRKARTDLRRGRIDKGEYQRHVHTEVERAVRLQEEADVDVIVHGEPERSDMVEHFAERLRGFALTEHGWVQSYGTRCARPPIIVGDISRPAPITVELAAFARSLTSRPVKGILTGPVTMLLWSYPRNDLEPAESCAQIALAVGEEVRDLVAAGVGIIQVDEPAFREGLPLRASQRDAYLEWAVRCFRLATARVEDAVQVHTHMCYADFSDILPAIQALDADVISLEAARSRMEIAAELAGHGYARQVGPGVYDVHAPQVPSSDEVAGRIRAALVSLRPEQLWVNPDCGLKTRTYPEVEAALRAMTAAVRQVRAEVALSGERHGPPAE